MKRTQFPNQKVRKNNEIKQKEAQKKKIKVEIYEAEKKCVRTYGPMGKTEHTRNTPSHSTQIPLI